MNLQLLIVLTLLAAAIAMFAIGRPRMDVVAVLMIIGLPLTGVLTVPETLAGFADPNVVLIGALFVVCSSRFSWCLWCCRCTRSRRCGRHRSRALPVELTIG